MAKQKDARSATFRKVKGLPEKTKLVKASKYAKTKRA